MGSLLVDVYMFFPEPPNWEILNADGWTSMDLVAITTLENLQLLP
jgi:hypothetical protein